ncbi:uncharacterized protein H6S33_007164 [Morchella sextelata]|uniref:uncharacterized protein n=1 Tax=Morchella sextelata TaxID=1174677 RepID=UPI001D03EC05|nr:uncharacterized protein H6S33_007164 [Morchella sextelata]KAH0604133.1 hypothetical protein H6S33_007164 [Morchella sextelata]
MAPFKMQCDCSMFGGTVHEVVSRRSWRRHMALKASDVFHATREATQRHAQRRSPSPELRRSDTPDLHLPDPELRSPSLELRSSSPDPSPRSSSETPPNQDYVSPVASPRAQVHVSPLTENHSLSETGSGIVHLLVPNSHAPYSQSESDVSENNELNGVDLQMVDTIDSIDSGSDESDSLEPLDFEEADATSGSDSDNSDIGQIWRGFVDLGSVDDPDIQYLSTDDESDDGLLSSNPHDDFDYIEPFGEPLTDQEMISIALDDISLKHKISREASRDTRELFSSVNTKLIDYRTI